MPGLTPPQALLVQVLTISSTEIGLWQSPSVWLDGDEEIALCCSLSCDMNLWHIAWFRSCIAVCL